MDEVSKSQVSRPCGRSSCSGLRDPRRHQRSPAGRRRSGGCERDSHQLGRHLRNRRDGASGTLGAGFNFWGTQKLLVIDGRTIGDIDFDPYLLKNADDAYADLLVLLSAGLTADAYAGVETLWLLAETGGNVADYVYMALKPNGAGGTLGKPLTIDLHTEAVLGGGAGGNGRLRGGLQTSFAVGETITGSFALTDPATGLPICDAVVTVSLMGIRADGTKFFAGWVVAAYDEATGQYTVDVATDGVGPGTYELIFQTNAGQTVTVEVEIL
jgi:hypothetical protein